MKIVRKPCAVAVASLLLALVWNSPSQAEWAGPFPVLGVKAHVGGCALVAVPPGNFNAAGHLVIPPGATGKKEMLAIALAAQMSGKRIYVWREWNLGTGCWDGTDGITDIQLVD